MTFADLLSKDERVVHTWLCLSGDEEPPVAAALRCGAATVCKAELHHHHHLEHSDAALTPVASL